MYNITFQQLATFFAVADRLNVTDAANGLYISQSSVSKSIRRLEEGLDIKLFIRSNKGMSLTKEGEYIFTNFRSHYNSMCKLIHIVKNMNKSISIRIGYPSTYDSSEDYDKLKQLISSYATEHPDVELSEGLYDFLELKKAITYGDIDIAFTHDFVFSDLLNMSVKRIFKSRVCIAMSAKHPLASAETFGQIDKSLLENEIFFTIPFTNELNDRQRMLDSLSYYGVLPKDIQFAQNFQSLVHILRQGKGMSLCGYFQKAPGHEEIRFFDLPDLKAPPYLSAAWRSDGMSAELKDFLNMIPEQVSR